MPIKYEMKEPQVEGKSEKSNQIRIFSTFLIMAAIIVMLFAYSSYLLQTARQQSESMQHPIIINPPMKFFIGTTPNVTRQQTFVPLNQTFCPENQTIIKKSGKLLNEIYYTTANTNSTFTYNLVVNTTSSFKILGAYVNNPFTIENYSIVDLTQQQCGGYPDGLKEIHVEIKTPQTEYTGDIYMVIYTSEIILYNGAS